MPRTTVNVYPSGTSLGKRTTNQRRNDQNSQMAVLGTLLPFPEDSALTKDKISVIRLTGAYLKFQKFLQEAGILEDDKHVNVTPAAMSNGKERSNIVEAQPDLFTSLLSKALDGFIMIVDQVGTVLFVSSDAADYISLTPSEITGHTLYEVSHHDDDELIKKNLTINDGDIIEAGKQLYITNKYIEKAHFGFKLGYHANSEAYKRRLGYGNQIWRQFCVRVRSSMSGVRSQVTRFGGFNMIHVSGFLKLIYQGDEGGGNESIHSSITVSPGDVANYRVIGLVAECHLIESPVIMELSVQHSAFAGALSMDLKFTALDTRVTQVLGFDKDDMVGQKIFDFFHPKEYYRTEHFVCWKKLMCQGRSTSPVYRFLTKNGEWIWLQMSATLTYIPNTKTPYAANFTFKVINSENFESGKKYKLIEHNEEYVMESNNCLSDQIKPHFPPPLNAMKNRPQENVNHVVNSLQNTPLSETAMEAFFHARNIGMDTFAAGMQPARLDDGTEPVKLVPDFTENPTLDSVFVPPTMSCSGAVPYGPELYVPSMSAQNVSTSSSPLSSAPSQDSNPAPIETLNSALPSRFQQQSATSNSNLLPSESHSSNSSASFSPSSGYASSPGEPSLGPNRTSVPTSSQQLENHLQYSSNSLPVNSHGLFHDNGFIPLHNNNLNGSETPTSIPLCDDINIPLPEIDPSIFDNLNGFSAAENHTPTGSKQAAQQRATLKQNNNGFSPFTYANSSIDDLIDQLIKEIPAEGDDVSSYPDLTKWS